MLVMTFDFRRLTEAPGCRRSDAHLGKCRSYLITRSRSIELLTSLESRGRRVLEVRSLTEILSQREVVDLLRLFLPQRLLHQIERMAPDGRVEMDPAGV